MKDYIVETRGLVSQRDLLRVSMQTAENAEAIRSVQSTMLTQQKEISDQQNAIADQQKKILEHDDILADALVRISNTVAKSELAPYLKQFEVPEYAKEYLIREGHPVRADVTYMDIYSRAKNSVYIIDNYINIKTLQLLQDVKPGVSVTVFSDNLQNKLHLSDVADFSTEFPSIPVSFITTGGIMHDRFIVLDYGKNGERMFHCGASSKDAAVKLTTAISELTSANIFPLYLSSANSRISPSTPQETTSPAPTVSIMKGIGRLTGLSELLEWAAFSFGLFCCYRNGSAGPGPHDPNAPRDGISVVPEVPRRGTHETPKGDIIALRGTRDGRDSHEGMLFHRAQGSSEGRSGAADRESEGADFAADPGRLYGVSRGRGRWV